MKEMEAPANIQYPFVLFCFDLFVLKLHSLKLQYDLHVPIKKSSK